MAAMTRQSVWIGSVPPYPLEPAVLKHPQELGLHAQRHLADLVQEQRASLRQLEPALLLAVGPGKAPRSWPKSSLSSNAPATPRS